MSCELFEQSLREGLGDKIKDDAVCTQLWCALANVSWYHPDTRGEADYSFRAAGGLIARLRGEGDYMDWYCCGPSGTVSELIGHTLRKYGWIYDDIGEICDEPGCTAKASCGAPVPGGYRRTCYGHMPRGRE